MEEYIRKGMVDIGKTDAKLKNIFKNKTRFADIFNGTLCGGEQVISPNELEQCSSEEVMVVVDKMGKEVVVERYRDIVMTWKDGCNLAILAIENQDKIHYAMPVRNMLYDALSYSEQMKDVWNNIPEEERPKGFSDEFFSRFRKKDKIYPVVTLVVYYDGSGSWDGYKEIQQMYGVCTNEYMVGFIKKYAANYKINLVNLAEIEDISVFKSDLHEFVGMIKCRKDKKKMKQFLRDNEEMARLDIEMRSAVEELLEVKIGDEHIVKKEGKKVVNVCKAWEDQKLSGKIEAKIEILVKKIKLGKTLQTIAVDLDEKMEDIEAIYDAVMECGVDEDVEKIYDVWESKVNKS